MGKKKKSSRNNKHASAQPNKAKQVQQLQKQQQQQQQQDSSAAAGPKAARNKKGASKSSPKVLASSAVKGSGTAVGSVPTGSGSPAPAWEPKRHLPTRGLVNVGNTCFFNSTLQNVFKARLLHQSLFGEDSGRRGGEYVGPVTKAFRKVLLEMKGEGPVGGRRGAYNPKALLTAVQRAHPSFRGYHQHDAHELFMRLVGTLEDEEDLCIKNRREEEREGDDTGEDQKKEETGAVNGEEREEDEGPSGQPEHGSGSGNADTGVGPGGDDGPRSGTDGEDPSNDEVGAGDVVASNVADERAGGAGGGSGGGKATQGTQEKGAAAAAGVLKDAKESASPGVPPVPEADSANAGLFRENKSAAVTGIACAENSDNDAQTPPSGGETSEPAEAAPPSKDKQAASSETGQAPRERGQGSDSAPASEKDGTKDTTVCGCRDAQADTETSTDDGETTDAGDLEDDDDDNNISKDSPSEKDASALTPRREPAGSSTAAVEANAPAGGGDTAGNEEKAGNQGTEHTAAVPPRASAGPQCAAVTEVFGGRLCSVVTCGSCGGRSFCTEPTVCLSLEIPFKAKAPSEKGLAYIAKKKAAAAAAAAAAKGESAPTESAASGLEPSSGAADDEADDTPEPDPTKAEGTTTESDGFVLSVSVKQKKKAARQERERQRLINAQKNAEEDHEVDNTGALAEESPGDKKVGVSTEGGGVGHRTPQDDEDEVRQCLEHVLSVCVSAAAGAIGAGGGSGDANTATEVDSEVAAAKHTTDESDIADLEKEEQAKGAEGGPEDMLAGFRLSTKERKKIARQEKNERQRTMEAKADAWAEDKETSTPHSPLEEVDERDDGGGKNIGAADAVQVGSDLETANQSRAPYANGDSDSAARALTGGPEKQSDATAAQAGGGCGASSGKRGDSHTLTKGHAAQRAESSLSLDEQRAGADCDAQSCGCGPGSGDDSAAVEASGKRERGKDAERVAGDASGRREQQPPDVELRNSDEVTSDEGAVSSSGSLAGCTTGETQGSTGHGGDGGSAFGSECSEGSAEGKRSDQDCVENAGLADSRLKRFETSNESQKEGETKPSKDSPRVDPASAQTGLDTCTVAAEGTDVVADEEERCQPKGGGSIAGDSGRGARRDGADPDEESSGTKQADSTNSVPPAPAGAAAAAAVPQNPLNRLQAPPPRAKPDRRHDPVGLDLYECLDHFVAEEALVAEDGNGYDCESCNSRSRLEEAAAARAESDEDDSDDHQGKGERSAPRSQQDARKRLLMLGRPPGMLVCHLKRLQAKKKVIRSVEFPIELDMSPYFWRDPDAPLTLEQTRYRLTGLIQHRGRRDSGHFVAYVRDGDEWKHASDSAIRTASLPEVKACEAYMLFYERFGGADAVAAAIEESEGSGVDDAAAVSDAPAAPNTKDALDTRGSGEEALTLEAETATAAEVTEERKEGAEDKGKEEGKGAKHASAEEGLEGEAGGKTCAAQGSGERAAAAGDAGDADAATGVETAKPAKSATGGEGVEEKVETANEIEEERGVQRTLV
ncbi:unnamed protein product [Scytosiphon promiscuus]